MQIYTTKSKNFDRAIDIYNVTDFNLKHIFECGQCFRWNPFEDGYIGIANGIAAFVTYDENDRILTIQCENASDTADFWINYFDLKRDYSEIKKKLSGIDKYLNASVDFGYGIRLLNQEPFETLISFILSANNNIPRIKGCIEKLSERYGTKTSLGLYTFPTPKDLIGVSSDEISECCHAGYRCEYIVKTVKKYIERPIDVSLLREFSLTDAENYIRHYDGVGPKVADCILLFTGSHYDAFPVDVWVKRVIEELYLGKESALKEINKFAVGHFGELAGFAQQYLFYFAREHIDIMKNIV
ncbi:MAG: 8-oxoguanine DNA glycosylase [Ruminococcaceae bacterium]|nr:8-oxoguanine DNA glycosylase [Oscillospiraceae bacterium]